MAADIAGVLRSAALGRRVAWIYREPRSGAVIGTSTYAPPDERLRSVHIGGTMTARAHWRTGVNTEAKLLLMARAFETLGAARVEWQTDDLNLRSQAAIERLGATREGVLRSHKPRRDGTRRDSVFYGLLAQEWPAAKRRLLDRLAAHDQAGSVGLTAALEHPEQAQDQEYHGTLLVISALAGRGTARLADR
jgi:RimJ/RimL family protein N-acetyltransferase